MALQGLGDGSVIVDEDMNLVSRAYIKSQVKTPQAFSLCHKKIPGEGHTPHTKCATTGG